MNYYLKILSTLFLILFLQNCEKDKFNDIDIDQISDVSVNLKSINDGFKVDGIDGYILMESIEYIGSCAPSSLRLSAVFNKGDDSAGKPILQGIELPKIIENGKIRYFSSENPSVLDDIYSQGGIDCNFNAEQINKYTSYSRILSFPETLCAATSIESDDFFPKDKDLTITWNASNKTQKLYVAVCAAGSPCFLNEYPDTGTLTISSNEFSSFQSGDPVFVYIGRGIADVVEQSNRVKIGLIRANWANLPRLIVE